MAYPMGTIALYTDQPKHQATALFLLPRTEVAVIGLNAWRASIHVPGSTQDVGADGKRKTVEHVLTIWPLYSGSRAELFRQTGCDEGRKMLAAPESAQAVAQ